MQRYLPPGWGGLVRADLARGAWRRRQGTRRGGDTGTAGSAAGACSADR
ncbi:hypothetical protein [Streptosporangium sp. NPDC001681]